MATDRATVAAVALLAVAAVLLANPLYLQEPDRGNQLVTVEHVSPAEGAAQRSADVTRVDDLPAVARYAARRGLPGGTFRVERTAPPLAVGLLASERRYLGVDDPDHLYRPTVSVGENATTVTFEAVPVETVERELGVTPPEGLREDDSIREIIWLSEQHPAVVFVGEFDAPWEDRLADGVESGELSAPHGNDASTLAPLGRDAPFVVQDDVAYRVAVTETDEAVVLETDRVTNDTLLTAADVATVETAELSPGTRQVVVDAIRDADGYHRFDGEAVDAEELEGLRDALVRHEGRYYMVHRGHVDDFSLVPLFRVALTALGGLVGLVGAFVGYRARGRSRR